MHDNRQPIEHVLADNLIKRRIKRRISDEDLARHAGLTPSAYRDIEEARYMPPVPVLVRIARALGCRLDDLLPIEDIE